MKHFAAVKGLCRQRNSADSVAERTGFMQLYNSVCKLLLISGKICQPPMHKMQSRISPCQNHLICVDCLNGGTVTVFQKEGVI